MLLHDFVREMLENYREKKSSLNLLKLELERFHGITQDEMIESLNLLKGDGDLVQTSEVSDKTAKIAISYREIAGKLNDAATNEILKDAATLEYDINFLENVVECLSPRNCEIIKDIYFNQLPASDVAHKHNMSERWLSEVRKRSIKKIVSQYEKHQKYTRGGEKHEAI